MKILRRHENIFFKQHDDAIRLVHLDQDQTGFLELDGISAWIVRDVLEVPQSREDLLEAAEDEFEDLPDDFEKVINETIDELISNQIVIEADE